MPEFLWVFAKPRHTDGGQNQGFSYLSELRSSIRVLEGCRRLPPVYRQKPPVPP